MQLHVDANNWNHSFTRQNLLRLEQIWDINMQVLHFDSVSDQYCKLNWKEEQTHISVKPFKLHFQEALQMDLVLGEILEELISRAHCRLVDDLVELLADDGPPTVAVQAK